ALFVMIDARVFAGGGSADEIVQYGTTICADAPQDPVTADLPGSRARSYLAEAHDGLDAGWCDHDHEIDRFEGFRALDDDSKAQWLAYIRS
ncbi:hypothetical protein, partial [Escherichia coli]|uniref:hypothetical protein n=1 Tax=Escherichia coli TaxID=562 RepID=UPI001934609A